jgi:hypothetical protein
LSQAIDAFVVFNAALDVYNARTDSVEVFRGLVTTAYFEQLQAEDAVRGDGTRTLGTSSFSEEKLVDPAEWGSSSDVALVVCRDVTGTKIVDAAGSDATPANRRLMIPMIVFFVESSEGQLLVEEVDQWNEEGYCAGAH